MERERAHGRKPVDRCSGGARSSARTEMRRDRRRRQQWTVIFLVALALQPQAVCAVGMFELQIRHFQNPQGVLQSGECCDLQATEGQRCSLGDQCDTFFKACLKEYQARVVPTGACTFGVGSTTVLGGNTQSLRHRGHDAGGGGGGDGTTGHIVIPFKYAWPGTPSRSLSMLTQPVKKSGQRGHSMRDLELWSCGMSKWKKAPSSLQPTATSTPDLLWMERFMSGNICKMFPEQWFKRR